MKQMNMKTVSFINRDDFDNWHKTPDFYIESTAFETMCAWCEENFGSDNWARILYQSRHVYQMGLKGRCYQKQIGLYFKNEADLSFFILKYGQKTNYV